jgi:phosphoglycolate phosphatase-like HAD superfamily hydrolase
MNQDAELPGLEELTPEQRDRVRAVGHEVDVPAGWSLPAGDQGADCAYLVLTGDVVVQPRDEASTTVGPGSFVGAVGSSEGRPATVTTGEPARTLAFSRADFAALRSELPAFDALVAERAEHHSEHDGATVSTEPVDTVVLDVDGTLVDSVYQHVRAWAGAFATVGVDVPQWRLHRCIGMGGDRLVTEVAGRAVEEAHGDRVRALHDSAFDEAIPGVRALPGARELMVELRRRGFNVVIASSGAPEQTARLLTLVDGDDIAHARTTSEDADESKPAPDLIDVAVERADGRHALVVGDAVWDVYAAKERGRPSIGLLCGGFAEDELRAAGAAFVYDDPQDLLDSLDETPLARRPVG